MKQALTLPTSRLFRRLLKKSSSALPTGMLICCLTASISASAAPADPGTTTPSAIENPLTYDARTLSLGGAGSALRSVGNGSLAIHNPALIDQVKQRAITATFTPYFLRLDAPFQFGNKKITQIQSGTLFGPFAQFGLNIRLTKRLVMGMVAFVTSAAGGAFTKIPLHSLSSEIPSALVGSARIAQVAGELLVPVAFTVAPWLTIAAAYRVTHAWQSAQLYSFNGSPMNQASLHGTNFLGITGGAVARLGTQLQVGLSYRNQVQADMNGSVATSGSSKPPAALSKANGFSMPHRFRLGLTYQPRVAPKLAIVAEARVWLYHLLNKQENNAYGGAAGVEYDLPHKAALRLGYSVSSQPVREVSASQFAVPPGLGHAVVAGGGAQLGDWQVDGSVGYLISGKNASEAPVPGRYMAQGPIASVTASYAI